jgi:hypothetical protein
MPIIFYKKDIAMIQLAEWIIQHNGIEQKIELLQGDLTKLPLEHAVDIIVLSAFPNDYLPTPTSLIGAFDGAGLSIENLSNDKQSDLRQQFSCWLSKPVPERFHFERILCVESGWRGQPPEIVDDIFRALAPFLLTDMPNSSVAISLIGAGDDGYSRDQMLKAILESTVRWMEIGLPLKAIKIVVYEKAMPAAVKAALKTFKSVEQKHLKARKQIFEFADGSDSRNDVFISYSSKNLDVANYVVATLKKMKPELKIYQDKTGLVAGGIGVLNLAKSLDISDRVVSLYSEEYWASPPCQMEYFGALARQWRSRQSVLFPIYISHTSDAAFPLMCQTLQYVDCRCNDLEKIVLACAQLVRELSLRTPCQKQA